MKDPVYLLQDAIEDERYVLRGYEKPSEALAFETLHALDCAFCRELIPGLGQLDESGRRMESIRKYSINAVLKRVLPMAICFIDSGINRPRARRRWQAGLDNRRQLGFGIPSIGLGWLVWHHKPSFTKLLLPSVQRRQRNARVTMDIGHPLLYGKHHPAHNLLFQFLAVTGHIFTPLTPAGG